MKEDCQATLSFLGLYNFIATKVEVLNNETQQCETISLIGDGDLQLLDSEPKEVTDSDLDDINCICGYTLKINSIYLMKPGMNWP